MLRRRGASVALERPWWPECVEARGVGDAHHRQPALDELATPKVMFDIFFVGPDDLAKRYKIVNGCSSVTRRGFFQAKSWIRRLQLWT